MPTGIRRVLDLRTRPTGALGALVGRAKALPPAQAFNRRVWRPVRLRHVPLVSVVVPFHDAVDQLPATLDSLAGQHHPRVEVVLVDDGSVDGSRALADAWARGHRGTRVLGQAHTGVGAARNRGAAAASGQYLLFCDADDPLPVSSLERLVGILESSGSDLAVGAVALQVKGRFEVPAWATRSNPRRQVGVSLDQATHLLGNLMLGARMFRRSFWVEHALRFADDERGDPAVVVGSLLAARRVDVVPSVVYRWSWREDNRSLLQQDLRDRDRVGGRIRAVREAGELLAGPGREDVLQGYVAELLHSVVTDLVRAAVCRDDGYWEALSVELDAFMATMSGRTLERVPVEDRVIAWLCARGDRPATEQFLEYAFDNQHGFPYRLSDGRPRIDLPFIDALAEAPDALTRVAEVDMPFRTRLLRVGWTEDDRLRIAGAAFADYLDDRSGPFEHTVVLHDRAGGREVRLPATPRPDLLVNAWAGRANEDHTMAGFEVLVAPADLPRDADGRASFLADVELRAGDTTFRGPVASRLAAGSPGLLEPRVVEGTRCAPTWRDHRGLGLVLRPAARPAARADAQPDGEPARPRAVRVDRVGAGDRAVALAGAAPGELEVALVGPRGASAWTRASWTPEDFRFEVEVAVLSDEWGLGETSLPAELYRVVARPVGGWPDDVAAPDESRGGAADGGLGAPEATWRVRCARELWRDLPCPVDSQGWTFAPQAGPDGALAVRVVPVEWQHSRPALLRRRLRDEVYPTAREQPLRDVVVFETFAGKGTGDNPGAVLEEFLRRDLGLELVFSVLDRSTVVPDGARAVIRYSEEYFELLGCARYLVVNASLPYFFRKREGQLYFQTWHGTPLKRIAHDRPHLDFFNWHHRRQLLVARDGWDYLLSQSPFCSESLRSAFRYTGPVLEVGYPRNDVLRSPRRDEVRRRTRAHFGLDEDTTAVLYAPTWRDNLRQGAVFNKVLYLDPAEVVAGIDNSAVLVRGHYNSVGAREDRATDGRILDVTRYPDIGDLYLAADVLVTDYSSVFFDFSLTDKPMMFLAPDLEQYRDDNRGFYLDYHDVVPGPVCQDTAEVVAEILEPDRYAARRAAFRARFNPDDDGHAAARVVEEILTAFPPGEGPGVTGAAR